MIINHHLDITHDFCIPPMSLLGHLGDAGIVTKHPRGLGVKHKRHCEKTLDPFCVHVSASCIRVKIDMGAARNMCSANKLTYELISPMGLESIYTAQRSQHEYIG